MESSLLTDLECCKNGTCLLVGILQRVFPKFPSKVWIEKPILSPYHWQGTQLREIFK